LIERLEAVDGEQLRDVRSDERFQIDLGAGMHFGERGRKDLLRNSWKAASCGRLSR